MIKWWRKRKANKRRPDDETVWIGDLSGFYVNTVVGQEAKLHHRCGYEERSYSYLGNLVGLAMEHRR